MPMTPKRLNTMDESTYSKEIEFTVEHLSILAENMMDDAAAKGDWKMYDDAMEAYKYINTLQELLDL